MVPKIIHYIWLGDVNNMTDVERRCKESWQKFLPDYEIKFWNQDNFDFSKSKFAFEAYQEKKYAFASDFIRLWALNNYGGVYLDTDVEVTKSFDDLLNNKLFVGFESDTQIATCVIGAEKNNEVIQEFLALYSNKPFVLGDGVYDMKPNSVIFTDLLKKYGVLINGKFQKNEYVTVYTNDYFCPFNSTANIQGGGVRVIVQYSCNP